MGTYINIGNYAFASIRNGEYTDKSELIGVVNGTLFTEHRFTCVTRSRRFGKSMAAKMLCAYYDKSCDSRQLFSDLKISKCTSFEKHLNKWNQRCLVNILMTHDVTELTVASINVCTHSFMYVAGVISL